MNRIKSNPVKYRFYEQVVSNYNLKKIVCEKLNLRIFRRHGKKEAEKFFNLNGSPNLKNE